MIDPVDISYDSLRLEIRTRVTLFPVAPFASGPTAPVVCEGLWDTGANSSSISERAARELDLTPVGCMEVETANGRRETPVYKVDVLLPNAHNVAHSLRVLVSGFPRPLLKHDGECALSVRNGRTK